jgi:glycosyltransferase involved in cell wall biosynthesis
MKIAFCTDGIFPLSIGGMQKHSYNLVKHLAQLGVWIDLYYFIPQDKENILLFSEEEMKYINPIIVDYPKIRKIPGGYLLSEYLYSRNIFAALKKQSKTDFIYAQGFTSWNFPKKFKNRTKIGLNLHGFEMFQMSASLTENYKKKLLQIPAESSIKKAEYIFSFGEKFVQLLESIHIPKSKQIVFFNGIDQNWLKKDSITNQKITTLLFVGRYETRKGIEILNQSIKQLIREQIDFRFLFAGSIPQDKQIADSNIQYLGLISTEEKIMEIYGKSDILVVPSLSEGMPTVILEAMAQGLAVIATDVGAVRAMVSPENGILIQPGNYKELEISIKNMISLSTEEIKLKKQNSLNKVAQHFTWTQIAQKHIDFFQSIK